MHSLSLSNLLGVCLVLGSIFLNATVHGAEPAGPPAFDRDVLPIFQARCIRCHGDKVQKADLDLRTQASTVKGGETGPGLEPAHPDKSVLWEKISSDKMPPGKEKLTAKEKAVLRAWIEKGITGTAATPSKPEAAPDAQVSEADRNFWSFQRPKRPAVPGGASGHNPIDAFIGAALAKKGLDLSASADPLTLLRRATFDLTGLPPTPGEIETFLADRAPGAYERLLDRLLASDHYGERWGRHWLDVAGYADSEGILDADHVRTHAWRYRDYVIRAFNQDKPYDRFLLEQIAGDELTDYWQAYRTQKQLPAEVVEALAATGFLRCASDTSRPDFVQIKNAPGYYYQTLEDTVKIVSSSLLGLTVQCAKCHSHKYDPIPQSDYYRVQAIFMSAYRPYQWVPQVQRRLLEATEAQEKEAQAHNAKIDAVVAPLRKQVEELQKQTAARLFDDGLGKLPSEIRADVRTAFAAEPNKRNEVQRYLVAKFEAELKPPQPADLEKLLVKAYPDYPKKKAELEKTIQAEEARKRTFPEIRAIYDLPGEPKTPLLRRGDYLTPGPEVRPGVLAVLAAPKPFAWTPPAKEAKTSGRRLAFAKWITQPDHPLTARVFVNRVWLHHFGEGLVSTPENFGRTGAAPTHPELLDWLATEFVARGWSIKALHRLVMTSRAYRQSSTLDPTLHARAREVDPQNRLLWRQRLRRLEAESLRDAVLSVAGNLNPQKFGPPVPIQRTPEGEVQVADDAAGKRRSIYLQVRRSQPVTVLQVFDQPVMETNCTQRGTSTVSSQALTLLNSEFLIRQAAVLAERVEKEQPADPAGYAVRLAFGRPIAADERARLASFLDTQKSHHGAAANASRLAMTDLCHMLLSANEFVYVD